LEVGRDNEQLAWRELLERGEIVRSLINEAEKEGV